MLPLFTAVLCSLLCGAIVHSAADQPTDETYDDAALQDGQVDDAQYIDDQSIPTELPGTDGTDAEALLNQPAAAAPPTTAPAHSEPTPATAGAPAATPAMPSTPAVATPPPAATAPAPEPTAAPSVGTPTPATPTAPAAEVANTQLKWPDTSELSETPGATIQAGSTDQLNTLFESSRQTLTDIDTAIKEMVEKRASLYSDFFTQNNVADDLIQEQGAVIGALTSGSNQMEKPKGSQ